jgi:molybdopterin synthase catalytic subunit
MTTAAGRHYTKEMSVPALAVVSEPLSVDLLTTLAEGQGRDRGEGCGAVAVFVGVVCASHTRRAVRHLEYEAYAPLAVKTFGTIASEAAARWPLAVLAIHHRVGRLEIGEASVVIAAAAAHRAESFQVCRYAIERIKQIAPIWKHEFFVDGHDWVEGPLADPGNEDLRRKAMDCACA